ncbi:trifunctional aldehyde reductase/xylose reductase/glucose 1-dehydrogenase (NADP(+)) KNAG_0B03780 [Huiozyma naganishii CBS 8797]|uniref:NADP-dependent oxidoreductase domain-containing protein n=1 Tax=Huiozyma naganishii (strain ATCC MYA-139 / BCRC 22969 / CBS 8797 / KCTC 17520 / NBRC 10181 / NCYC 3082 / Yp74L-3) TaxID=1071383 RepID=J7S3N3_HUIN7|nr:hypothetical protein KNAG_0B03780 [Kazachstania naganishii CBS 8797]CCK68819.1 hypothetical protein KNAG_0B03780 [Kazachstania naganishii CBS 8797]
MSETVTLNNGLTMPLVGLGCWKISPDICAEQVYEAIKLGYRLFDGACDYGNEKQVGDGIRRAIDEGIVKREDLFVVSKLWNTYHDPKHVKLALQRTLDDMKLEYLDLYYIHFPLAFKFVPFEERYPPGFYTGAEDAKKGILTEEKVALIDTYRAMEELVDEGLTKSIGISNYAGALVQDTLRGCRIKPVCLQIEHHPYLTQEKLVEYCKLNGIQVVAYSSFGPQSFVDIDQKLAKHTPPLFDHPVIKKIAQEHKVTTSQVILRWATQRGIAVIPKSAHKGRLLGNLQIDQAVTLTPKDLEEISSLNKNLRFNDTWDWTISKFPSFH